MAAGRFLAAAGVDGRILVREAAGGGIAGWTDDLAVVRVSGSAARDAALETARAAGVSASTEEPQAAAMPGDDRRAARFEVGLEPDETVELVLGAAALRDLGERLAALDATLAADPTPRRLVLAGLPDHSPELTPDLVAAIVHPQVLVESEPSDAALLAILRRAADEIVEDDDA
jgi:hypothetical protein